MVERPYGMGDDPPRVPGDHPEAPATPDDARERDRMRDPGAGARDRLAGESAEAGSPDREHPAGDRAPAPQADRPAAPERPRASAGDDAGNDLGARARDRHAGAGGAGEADEPRTADERAAGDGDLRAQADQIAGRLGRGEIDEATHDAAIRDLVERSDPTLPDPTPVMEVAERIHDGDLREWTQAGVLGRYADAQEYSDLELAGFAEELGTDAGVDGFIAGLSTRRRAEVRAVLEERAGARDADRDLDRPGDAERPERPVAELGLGDDDLVGRADAVGARLDRGDIDVATHDAEVRALVERAEATQAAMDAAARIRDPDVQEWTQANVLGRDADARGYSDDELAALAVELGTDARVDAFLAGLSPDLRVGVLDVLGERSQWPVAHTSGWTATDRELFREAGSVSRGLEEGAIDDTTHDERLQQLAGRADPAAAGWEITHHIRDPEARAETRADLAGAVARNGDRTMAWEMADSIDPEVTDSRGRQIRSHALAEVAEASVTRDAAEALVGGIADPRIRDEVVEILAEADVDTQPR